MIAIDVDFVRLPTTPLELLVTTLAISLVIAVAIMIVTLALSPLVDKRWPATQPLNPTELLWAETGGYVQSHFRGLDFDIARDVAGQMSEKKVKAGQFVFEQGDPAAAFFVVKDGQVEVLQRVGNSDQVIRTYGPGDSFGEVAILRRSARTASVRALSDATLLELPADEFVAATALSAAEENPLLTAVDRYLAEDRARLAPASVGAKVDRAGPAPAPAPAPAAEPAP
ncbi:MAG: cyclic nucleotide-binding domain-containing protein, partial [Acidimicrobiia bacterium]